MRGCQIQYNTQQTTVQYSTETIVCKLIYESTRQTKFTIHSFLEERAL